MILPSNVYVRFPLQACKNCDISAPVLEDLGFRFDCTAQYKLTCAHAEACDRYADDGYRKLEENENSNM